MDELTRLARDRDCSMFDAILALSPDSNIGGPLVSSPFTARAVRALTDFRNLIDELRSYAESNNIVDLIDHVLARTGYRDYLSGLDDRPDERLENIDEFKAASRDYMHLGPVEGLSAFLESVSLVSDVDSMEEKPDLITLITLHQAKGLEYPIVFMAGMEDGLLPHSRSMDEPADLEEERRLCYVGMTRAKDRLYLSRAFRRGFRGGTGPNSPSRGSCWTYPGSLSPNPERRTAPARSAPPRFKRPAGPSQQVVAPGAPALRKASSSRAAAPVWQHRKSPDVSNAAEGRPLPRQEGGRQGVPRRSPRRPTRRETKSATTHSGRASLWAANLPARTSRSP